MLGQPLAGGKSVAVALLIVSGLVRNGHLKQLSGDGRLDVGLYKASPMRQPHRTHQRWHAQGFEVAIMEIKSLVVVERVKGIEPSYAAWEAAVLPLNYTRNAIRRLLTGFP